MGKKRQQETWERLQIAEARVQTGIYCLGNFSATQGRMGGGRHPLRHTAPCGQLGQQGKQSEFDCALIAGCVKLPLSPEVSQQLWSPRIQAK